MAWKPIPSTENEATALAKRADSRGKSVRGASKKRQENTGVLLTIDKQCGSLRAAGQHYDLARSSDLLKLGRVPAQVLLAHDHNIDMGEYG